MLGKGQLTGYAFHCLGPIPTSRKTRVVWCGLVASCACPDLSCSLFVRSVLHVLFYARSFFSSVGLLARWDECTCKDCHNALFVCPRAYLPCSLPNAHPGTECATRVSCQNIRVCGRTRARHALLYFTNSERRLPSTGQLDRRNLTRISSYVDRNVMGWACLGAQRGSSAIGVSLE